MGEITNHKSQISTSVQPEPISAADEASLAEMDEMLHATAAANKAARARKRTKRRAVSKAAGCK